MMSKPQAFTAWLLALLILASLIVLGPMALALRLEAIQEIVTTHWYITASIGAACTLGAVALTL